MRFLFLLCIFVFTQVAQATDRVATGVSYAEVKTAYDACVSGSDRLLIPAGSAIWDRNLHVTKDIDIIGVGSASTTIVDNVDRALGTSVPTNSNYNESIFSLVPPANSTVTVSGISFTPGVRATPYSNGAIQTEAAATFIFSDLKFTLLNRRAMYFWGGSRGLVTGCEFTTPTGVQAMVFNQDKLHGGTVGDGSYVNEPGYGSSSEWMYVENCTVNGHTNGGLNMTDGFAGAKFVVRFCTIKEIGVGVHGTESANRYRGARALEVYNNTFIDAGGSADYALIELRSGCGKFFDNTASGNWNYDFVLTCYRNWAAFPPWCGADGTLLWDVNDTTDGAGTPGGAGDGVFDSGTVDTANTLDWTDTVGVTVTQAGNVVTSSSSIFTSAMVGKYIFITHPSTFYTNRQITGFTNGTTVTVATLPSPTISTPREFIVGTADLLNDSTKSWTTNQWQGYTLREKTGNFTATGTGTRSVTVSGANWIPNQWYYWTLVRVSDGARAVVSSNTATTLSLSTNGAALSVGVGNAFYLSRGSEISSNTANQIIILGQGATQSNYVFTDSSSYEIRRVINALDQPGRGTTLPITPPGTINIQPQNLSQQLDPIYEWNNSKNGVAWGFNIAERTIVENREFYRYNTSFTGTAGTGRGTRATMNAITSPTPGVGFWVTDEGEWNSTNGATPDGRLYVANASGVWTLNYTPLTYPHPLSPSAVADTTAPTLTSATIDTAGTTMTLLFSEAVTGVNSAAFAMSGGRSVSSASGSGATWTLAVSPAAAVATSYTLNYTPGAIIDSSSNAMASVSGFSITNNTASSDTTAPTLVSATINGAGTTLTLVYSESVTGVSTSHYTMSGGRSLSSVSGSGTTRTMTISPAAAYAAAYTISYVPGTTVDTASNSLAALTDYYTVNGTDAPSAPSTRNTGRIKGKRKLIGN